jgi:F-type H+-transporting ATPase subunit a
MEISPDAIVYWQSGLLKLNATILFTWIVMALLTAVSWLVTRRLKSAVHNPSRGQNALEAVVEAVQSQIREISQDESYRYLPFVGTLFLFVVVSNVLAVVPGFQPPTASLSTTAALALCVFVAVPIFGVSRKGPRAYLKQYTQPSLIMLPFNIIGEISRTLALAVRLYGNMMSGAMIVAILLAILPIFVPVVMQLLGLLTGVIQAYIFSVLAMVYIASAVQMEKQKETQ